MLFRAVVSEPPSEKSVKMKSSSGGDKFSGGKAKETSTKTMPNLVSVPLVEDTNIQIDKTKSVDVVQEVESEENFEKEPEGFLNKQLSGFSEEELVASEEMSYSAVLEHFKILEASLRKIMNFFPLLLQKVRNKYEAAESPDEKMKLMEIYFRLENYSSLLQIPGEIERFKTLLADFETLIQLDANLGAV